jgi:hypothetical protein
MCISIVPYVTIVVKKGLKTYKSWNFEFPAYHIFFPKRLAIPAIKM